MKTRIALCMLLVAASLGVLACGASTVSGPTPTPTLPPVTPTPACALQCSIDTEQYSFGITCESGSVSTEMLGQQTEYLYDSSGNQTGLKLSVNQKQTYENTKNTYTIEGTIELNQVLNTVSYDITVTGGVFGNTPQTCNSGAAEQSQPLENSPTPTTNPALNELPSGLREAVAKCGGHPPCSLLSAEKVKTLTDFDKQYNQPQDGELYCLVVSFSNSQGETNIRTPYGYYNGTKWMVMFDWTEQDFVEHGCTNFPE